MRAHTCTARFNPDRERAAPKKTKEKKNHPHTVPYEQSSHPRNPRSFANTRDGKLARYSTFKEEKGRTREMDAVGAAGGGAMLPAAARRGQPPQPPCMTTAPEQQAAAGGAVIWPPAAAAEAKEKMVVDARTMQLFPTRSADGVVVSPAPAPAAAQERRR